MTVQLALAFFGLAALWMSQGDNLQARRWAPVVGMLGQPFWIVFAIDAGAWGLLLLSLAYTVVYVRGAMVQWRYRRWVRSGTGG